MPVSVAVSSSVAGLGFMLDETGAQILDEAGLPIRGDHPAGDVTISAAAASVTISISED